VPDQLTKVGGAKYQPSTAADVDFNKGDVTDPASLGG